MLVLERVATKTAEDVTPTISSEERRSLERFVREQEVLASSAAFKRSARPMEMRADPEKGASIHGRMPSDEDLIVVLHRLRPFILNDEPYSFNRVSGILARAFAQQPIRDVLKEERRRYDGRVWQRELKISSGSKTARMFIAGEITEELDARLGNG